MMNILILSDSHGRSDLISEAISRTCPQAVLFAGDGLHDLSHVDIPCPVYAVQGNCDFFLPLMELANGEPDEEALFGLSGFHVLLMHGHRYGVKGGMDAAIAHAVKSHADILVFGHTHKPVEFCLSPGGDTQGYDISLKKPLYVFNPGAVGDRPHMFGTLTVQRGIPLFGHGKLE